MLIMLVDVDDEESPLLCGIPYPAGSTSAYQVSVILAGCSTHSGRVQRVCTAHSLYSTLYLTTIMCLAVISNHNDSILAMKS